MPGAALEALLVESKAKLAGPVVPDSEGDLIFAFVKVCRSYNGKSSPSKRELATLAKTLATKGYNVRFVPGLVGRHRQFLSHHKEESRARWTEDIGIQDSRQFGYPCRDLLLQAEIASGRTNESRAFKCSVA